MHDDTPRDDGFWNLVAAYIDREDVYELRREWTEATFADVAIHVASCIPCLERRLLKLKAWKASGATAEEGM